MDIKSIHEILNNIYDKAESVNDELKRLNYKVELDSFNKHFINIDNKYLEQKYFMPVITVLNKGDICFNLNSIEFEFYVTHEDIKDIDLESLISNYKESLNIYEFTICTTDLYKIGDTYQDLLDKINKSTDSKFGISINVTRLSIEDIIKTFNKVCLILKK